MSKLLLLKARIILPFFTAWMLGGCGGYGYVPHYYYVQNNHQVPLFVDKNEFRASASIGKAVTSSTIDLKAACSITRSVAVTSSALFMSAEHMKGQYYDGGLGYFKKVRNIGIFEVYGGFGAGRQHHNYYFDSVYIDSSWLGTYTYVTALDNGNANVMYLKYYIQPSFGYTHKYFDAALSCRVSDIYYSRAENNIRRDFTGHYKEVETLRDHRNLLLIEPALTLRGGWNYIKIQLQFAGSLMMSNSKARIEDSGFNLGLYFSLAGRFKKMQDQSSP